MSDPSSSPFSPRRGQRRRGASEVTTDSQSRAVLMLGGGAVSDHIAPRRIMMMTVSTRTIFVGAVGVLVFFHVVRLWHLYILAFAFGVLISSWSGGALIGSIVSGTRKQRTHRGWTMIVASAVVSLAIAAVGVLSSELSIALVLALAGLAGGYNNIVLITWFQERVQPQFMGRVMSVLMFGWVGLMPVSYPVAGALAQCPRPGSHSSSVALPESMIPLSAPIRSPENRTAGRDAL